MAMDHKIKPSWKSLTKEDLRNKEIFDQIELSVRREKEQKLGCRVTEKGVGVICVTSVESGAPTYGVLYPGDFIICINGHKVRNRAKLFHYIDKSKSKVKLVVARYKGNSESSSSSRSHKSKKIVSNEGPMVKKAASMGFKIKENKEYLTVNVMKDKHKRLALGIKRTKNGKIVISRIEPDSYALNILHVGDHLLAINDRKVTEKRLCHELITECKGEFVALIERCIKEETVSQLSTVSDQFKSSYSDPNPRDIEHNLGNPQIGYETAPKDVQNILNERLPSILQSFNVPPQKRAQDKTKSSSKSVPDKTNNRNKSETSNASSSSKVTVQLDVYQKEIPSDYDTKSLRKIPKNSTYS